MLLSTERLFRIEKVTKAVMESNLTAKIQTKHTIMQHIIAQETL